MMQSTTFLSHHIYMYDWLILLRWGSLELLQGTFLYVISGRGLVNNNCQENGINEDNYCNGRIGNLIEEPLKMAIVRNWFFVWKKSPAYLFNHEERQNPTEVDLFGQINMCTSWIYMKECPNLISLFPSFSLSDLFHAIVLTFTPHG